MTQSQKEPPKQHPFLSELQTAPAYRQTARSVLLLVVLLLPVFFLFKDSPVQNTNSTFPKLIVLLALPGFFVIPILASCLRSLWQDFRQKKISPVIPPTILFLLYLLFQKSRPEYPDAGNEEFFRLLSLVTLFLGSFLFFHNRRLSEQAWSLAVLVATLVSTIAIIEFFDLDLFGYGHFTPWALPLRRVFSTLGNPNFLGGFLVLTLPLTIVALIGAGRLRFRSHLPALLAALVQALLIVVCLVQGGSSSIDKLLFEWGGMEKTPLLKGLLVTIEVIGLALPTLLYFLFCRWWATLRYPVFIAFCLQLAALGMTFSIGSLVGLLGASVVLLLLFLTANLFQKSQTGISPRAKTAGALVVATVVLLLMPTGWLVLKTRQASFLERREMYRGAAAMIREHPVLGFGPGMFSVYFPDYRPEQLTLYLSPSIHFVENVHNEYLQLASELGLVGLALFVWIVAAALFEGLRLCLQKGSALNRLGWLRAALAAAVFGTLAQGMISVNLRQPSTAGLFWLWLGWLAASRGTVVFNNCGERSHKKFQWTVSGLALLVAAVWSAPALVHYQADVMMAEGLKARQNNRPRQARMLLERALEVEPGSAEGYYHLAGVQYDTGDYEAALESYRKVQALERHFVDVVFNQATTLVQLHRYDEAISLYKEALERDPQNPRLRDYCARALILAGRNEEAFAMRRSAIELFRQRLALYPNEARLYHDLGKNLMFEALYSRRQPESAGQVDTEALWEESLLLLDKAVEMQPFHPTFRQSVREHRSLRGQG
jgi:tetratricopeptide (TPR) repeat protein